MRPASARSPSPATDAEALGLAHVASASFVGSRLAPSMQYWLALPGGVALARAAARMGASRGYGASLAAMLQGVAILGPLRVNAPLTQAMTAPMLGRLEARGAPMAVQVAACLALRLLHYTVLTVFGIWLILGGVDAYVRTYEATTGWLGFVPQGRTAALALLLVQQLAAGLFFTVVQVAVYRRALRRWPQDAPTSGGGVPDERDETPCTHDPRLLALAALVAFALLLAGTAPALLAGVTAWLAIAWLVARPDPQVVRIGAALAALLALTTFAGGLLGALGPEHAAERAVRAALLVLVATWLRGAAGPEGMREVFRAVLGRLRRLGWAREAGDLLERLDSAGRLTEAGRALLEELRPVRKRPIPVADATASWVAAEAGRGPSVTQRVRRTRLVGRARDRVLVALAVAPALGLVVGG